MPWHKCFDACLTEHYGSSVVGNVRYEKYLLITYLNFVHAHGDLRVKAQHLRLFLFTLVHIATFVAYIFLNFHQLKNIFFSVSVTSLN